MADLSENDLWIKLTEDKSLSAPDHHLNLFVEHYLNSNMNIFETRTFSPNQNQKKSINEYFMTLLRNILSNGDAFINDECKILYLRFLISCVKRFDIEEFRSQILRLSSILIWRHILRSRRDFELGKDHKLTKMWNYLNESGKIDSFYVDFLPNLISSYFTASLAVKVAIIDLIIELESNLITRRYFHIFIDDVLFVHRIAKEDIHYQKLMFWFSFPIDLLSGAIFNDLKTKRNKSSEELALFQRFCFKEFPDLLQGIYLASVEQLLKYGTLSNCLAGATASMEKDSLKYFMDRLLEYLHIPNYICTETTVFELIEAKLLQGNHNFIQDALNEWVCSDVTENEMSIKNIVKKDDGMAFSLGIQYLSHLDYFYRNFGLYKSESIFRIKQDFENILSRIKPYFCTESNTTKFKGWSSHAVLLSSCKVLKRHQEFSLRESKNSFIVRVLFSTDQFPQSSPFRQAIIDEWNSVRENEIIFLISIKFEANGAFEIEKFRSASVARIESNPEDESIKAFTLTLNKIDFSPEEDTFNLLMRRDSDVNNYNYFLDALRKMIFKCEENTIPSWFQDTLLGFGNPNCVSWNFLLKHHLEQAQVSVELFNSVPNVKILNEILNSTCSEAASVSGNFVSDLRLTAKLSDNLEHLQYSIQESNLKHGSCNNRRGLEYTYSQSEAILRGSMPGLSLIVGPPGTGKTEVATQIIENIYNSENHKILVFTHSNHALDALIEKLSQRDGIQKSHILRLGGQSEEATSLGRIEAHQQHLFELLLRAQEIIASLGILGDYGSSCERAGYCFNAYIEPAFQHWLSAGGIKEEFPFSKLYPLTSSNEDPAAAIEEGKNIYLQKIYSGVFKELKDLEPFEIIKTYKNKSNYLLTKEARIILMTSTHAAIKHSEFIELGFKVGSVVAEEAGQLLEIETLLPLSFIKSDPLSNRIVLIGDNKQFPPLVQNQSCYSLSMSLFSRLLLLGTDHVFLNTQMSCKPSLSSLFSYRYSDRLISSSACLQLSCNPGFLKEAQFVNVEDFQGVGESQPMPHYFQNLGEAEFIVTVFKYMRLIGYAASQITILTTYNGQKDLICEIIQKRCAWNHAFGTPKAIATVDKYQGEQNDYVLLSLTRSKNSPGHITVPGRLTVAFSRARLGLYVFGRKSTFENVSMMKPIMEKLLENNENGHLKLFPNERCLNIGNRSDTPVVEISNLVEMVDLVSSMASS